MSITLNSSRQRVARYLDGPYYVSATASSGSVTTLTDATNLVHASGGNRFLYEGAWVLRTTITTSDRERTIDSYDPATGTLVVSPPYLVTVGAEAYEVWYTFRPTFVEQAINEALIAIGVAEEEAIVGVADAHQYSLASYPWILHEGQIQQIRLRTGTTPAYTYTLIPRSEWELFTDRDALTLNFPNRTFAATDTLILTAKRSSADLGTLAAGADTVALPNDTRILDWIACEACHWLLTFPAARRMGPDNQQQRMMMANDFRIKADRYRDELRVVQPRSILRTTGRSWGFSGRSW